MTMKSGSDAQACLHSLFRNCVDMAPSVLLIDPLQEIAADNPNRRINRSDVDQALLSELRHILEEAKSSGVTIIGITTQENSCLSRVVRAFDEKIEFFSPSQQDRIAYFRHLINHFVDMSSTKIDPSRFAEYLSLHSFIFIISFHIDLLSLGQILIIVSEMQWSHVPTPSRDVAHYVFFSQFSYTEVIVQLFRIFHLLLLLSPLR